MPRCIAKTLTGKCRKPGEYLRIIRKGKIVKTGTVLCATHLQELAEIHRRLQNQRKPWFKRVIGKLFGAN